MPLVIKILTSEQIKNTIFSIFKIISLNSLIFIEMRKYFFTIPCPKVPLSLPAQKRECGIFGPGMVKNSIRSTGVKLASPHLVFATLAFGSGGNLYEIWTVQDFPSLGA